MGRISDLFEKIKSFFNKKKFLDKSSRPTIEIHDRYNLNSMQHSHSSSEVPQITIREVHRCIQTETERDIYRREVDVPNPNIGHGITVKKQRKPGRCPLCATKGKVVENTARGGRWKCEECGSTFN
jgi:rubrerythrin